jgi:hypothetical protein
LLQWLGLALDPPLRMGGRGRKRAERARGRAADSSSRALAMGAAVRCAYIGAGSYPCRDRGPRSRESRPRLVALPSQYTHGREQWTCLDSRRRRARLPLPVVYLRDRVTLSLSARMVWAPERSGLLLHAWGQRPAATLGQLVSADWEPVTPHVGQFALKAAFLGLCLRGKASAQPSPGLL